MIKVKTATFQGNREAVDLATLRRVNLKNLLDEHIDEFYP